MHILINRRCMFVVSFFLVSLIEVFGQSAWIPEQNFRFSTFAQEHKLNAWTHILARLAFLSFRSNIRDSVDEVLSSSHPRFRHRLCSGKTTCTSNEDCRDTCKSQDYECIGCPSCENQFQGKCYPRDTKKVFCEPLSCSEDKACASCVQDNDCSLCGVNKKCIGGKCTIEIPENKPPQDCFIGGCGGDLCGDERLYGTCEYRPEDRCYGLYGKCGRYGANGECMWKPSRRLRRCIASYKQD